jgi:uncharacterized protein DUF4287/uncharacterized protein DUF5655
MSFQAYIDNIKTKTGMTPGDFKRAAESEGMLRPGVKTGEIAAWLKGDYDLGRGHAMAIVLTLKSGGEPKTAPEDGISRHFKGDRARWHEPYERLLARVRGFGPGVSVGPTSSYIGFLRNHRKFAVVQVTGDRLDVGIKLKGEPPTSRFEAAGTWNSMVTHRVRISEPRQLDAQVIAKLKDAFDRA